MEVSGWSHSVLSKFDDILLLPALAEHENDVPKRKWMDERGRIRIWATNTGAHHRGVLSLDYRLRDAPVIKNQTVKILQRLQQLFEAFEEVLDEDGGETIKEDDDEEMLRMLQAQLDEVQNNAGLQFNESEVSHIFKTVVETVTQLYQLSMAISPLSDYDRLTETKDLDSALRAIHGGNGESILPQVSLTSANEDLGIDQILIRCRGTQYQFPVPKISVTRGKVTVGTIRAMAAERFGVTDTSRIRLISRGNLLKNDNHVLEKTWVEQSREIKCMIPWEEARSQGDDSGCDEHNSLGVACS
ncbi:hypothetical protein N7465_006234 [Penicillium sp. CMV-2018d]|nr:hypothetical protein N7465_006234 [Penicillium sp. CMV-2018d]